MENYSGMKNFPEIVGILPHRETAGHYGRKFKEGTSPGAIAVLGVKPCKNSEHQVFGTVEKFRISSFI